MLRLAAFAAGLAFACSALAQDPGQTRYAVLIMEKPAGAQTTTVAADGSRNLSYEFNDRGRGPKLTARVRLDAAGMPILFEMAGRRLPQGASRRALHSTTAFRSLDEQCRVGEEKSLDRVLSQHARTSGRAGMAGTGAAESAGTAHGVAARG